MQVDVRVSANSCPCIHDWNEDGKKDLIIGEIEHVLPDTGNIRVYLNFGTNAVPFFRGYQLMQAGGGHLEVVHAHPAIFDLDGDSLKDLVCGNENGFLYFFKNRATNQAPYFEVQYETLMTEDSVFLDGYTNSRIHCTDWTRDGDLDIILGGQDGYVWLCENVTISGGALNRSVTSVPGHFRIIMNPVQHVASFSCMVSVSDRARLCIYSISGRMIDEVILPGAHVGPHVVQWKIPLDLCAGVYFAVLETRNAAFIEKVVVTR